MRGACGARAPQPQRRLVSAETGTCTQLTGSHMVECRWLWACISRRHRCTNTCLARTGLSNHKQQEHVGHPITHCRRCAHLRRKQQDQLLHKQQEEQLLLQQGSGGVPGQPDTVTTPAAGGILYMPAVVVHSCRQVSCLGSGCHLLRSESSRCGAACAHAAAPSTALQKNILWHMSSATWQQLCTPLLTRTLPATGLAC